MLIDTYAKDICSQRSKLKDPYFLLLSMRFFSVHAAILIPLPPPPQYVNDNECNKNGKGKERAQKYRKQEVTTPPPTRMTADAFSQS